MNKGSPLLTEQIGELKNISQINIIGDSIIEGALSGYYKICQENIGYYVEKMTGTPVNNYGKTGTQISYFNKCGPSINYRINKINYKENDITIIAGGINDCNAKVDIKTFIAAYSDTIHNWLKNRKEGSKLIICTLLPENEKSVYMNKIIKMKNSRKTWIYSFAIRQIYDANPHKDIYLMDLETAAIANKIPNPINPDANFSYYGMNGLHPNYFGYYKLGQYYSNYLIENFGTKNEVSFPHQTN